MHTRQQHHGRVRRAASLATRVRPVGPTDRLGCLRISRREADAGRVTRTPALIGRSPEDLVVFGLQVAGTATFVQDGRRAELGGGDLVLYDTARPFSVSYPERFATQVFQLPRHVLGPSCAPAVGQRPAGHVVDLFATLITKQARREPDGSRAHLVRSAHAFARRISRSNGPNAASRADTTSPHPDY
ncbi:hypothetical protein [Streptomyces cyanogenus]|uniref:DNA-binding transcriptional activator FeaR n=1 Tax=Streptomyces cyanogenus TaxID=80860 RepID=A0ABX7TIY3_STRCY|nr:hypothetical protein [Streptomyces cyanogenus]QTD96559.1 DNA-binding transcriptional activator FeaR [Streptomyces cyanogenus]